MSRSRNNVCKRISNLNANEVFHKLKQTFWMDVSGSFVRESYCSVFGWHTVEVFFNFFNLLFLTL